MKRLLTILMVLMLLFVNVGCGEKGRLQEDNDTNIQQETKDKEKNLYDPADDIKPIAVGTVTISISCVTLLNHLQTPYQKAERSFLLYPWNYMKMIQRTRCLNVSAGKRTSKLMESGTQIVHILLRLAAFLNLRQDLCPRGFLQ